VARAGNVIGGGDASKERLLPDILRSFAIGNPVEIRYPNAVRPWQHVLDCLHGYLLLVEAIQRDGVGGAWNFGPGPASFATVADVAARTATLWGPGASVTLNTDPQPHEAGLLTLDSTKSRDTLGWRDMLSLDDALAWTVAWEHRVSSGSSAINTSLDQIAAFADLG
jgi:CDP-glucose 4,6-dehydratase